MKIKFDTVLNVFLLIVFAGCVAFGFHFRSETQLMKFEAVKETSNSYIVATNEAVVGDGNLTWVSTDTENFTVYTYSADGNKYVLTGFVVVKDGVTSFANLLETDLDVVYVFSTEVTLKRDQPFQLLKSEIPPRNDPMAGAMFSFMLAAISGLSFSYNVWGEKVWQKWGV